jgi:hypothetical protein
MDDDILGLIKTSVRERRIFWTYHVTMRMKERFIPRSMILGAIDSYEIIEEYPDDRYMPSYLIRAENEDQVFHTHIEVDRENDNVRIITAYRPTLDKWEEGFRKRRMS